MKIGVFDPYLDTLSGGEKYMLTLTSYLSNAYDVSIFWDPKDEKNIKQKALEKLGIDIAQIPFVPNIFNKNVSTVSRLLTTKDFDRIIFLSDGSFPLTIPKLIVHFQFPVEWVNAGTLISKIKTAKISKFICNSEFTKSYIDKKFNVNSFVLYPPVTIKKYRNIIKKENIILNVGRFGIRTSGSSYKKQDVLANVFEQMVKQGLKKWKLVFIMSIMESDMKKLEYFKKKIKNLPIHFIVNPTNKTLWDFYYKAKIYWHASGFGEDIKTNPDRAEHFGISTVEAMGAGAVAVVINAGGQRETVQDNKNGFLWDTKEELIAKTNTLINNESFRQEIAENGIKRAKDFSEEKFCAEISKLIQ